MHKADHRHVVHWSKPDGTPDRDAYVLKVWRLVAVIWSSYFDPEHRLLIRVLEYWRLISGLALGEALFIRFAPPQFHHGSEWCDILGGSVAFAICSVPADVSLVAFRSFADLS